MNKERINVPQIKPTIQPDPPDKPKEKVHPVNQFLANILVAMVLIGLIVAVAEGIVWLISV